MTRVYFDGRLETPLLGASFTAKGDLGTDGKGDLALMLESSETSQLNIGGFDIDMSDTPEAGFHLYARNASFCPTEGSVGFTGWISGVPGMPADENDEPAKLDVAGNIHSNGAFRVSSSCRTGSELRRLRSRRRVLAVANYDPETTDPGSLQSWPFGTWDPAEVRVYVDGGMSLLGTSFDVEGDLGTDGTGELTLALGSNGDSFSYTNRHLVGFSEF